MSSGDPDLDAVLAESEKPVASGDPDLDAVISEARQAAPVKRPVQQATGYMGEPNLAREPNAMDITADRLLGGTVRGVVGGYKGLLSLGKGSDKAAQAVESVTGQELPATTGPGKAAEAVLSSPYNPLNYIDEAGQLAGDKAAELGAPPSVSTGLRMVPDVVASALGFKGGRAAGPKTMAEPQAVANAPHPLAGIVDSEAAKFNQAKQAGIQAGLNIPDRTPSPQVVASNGMIQEEFGLPKQTSSGSPAPITPKILGAARKQFGSTSYNGINEIKKIQLGSAYEDDIANIDLSKIDEAYRPPPGGSFSGERGIELSRYLRNQANKYYAAAKGNPELEATADAHWDAAEAVEDAIERRLRATGKGELADQWDADRIYNAKTFSVQSALDGAGNVVVPALKRQLLKNKPLSGNLETLATLGAMTPDAFKNTPAAPLQVGLGRQAAALAAKHLIPVAGAAGGSILGVPGAAAGGFGGKLLGDRIADRIAPP